ncbi:MAG TPA: Flp family type IVb pilin [Clostridia bacterium]|nr:Flp family type IVb pilin [Clostridia bacterium]
MITKLYNYWYNIKETLKDKKGQGMVEYALIIGLVAVLLIGALGFLQDDIEAVFTQITGAI